MFLKGENGWYRVKNAIFGCLSHFLAPEPPKFTVGTYVNVVWTYTRPAFNNVKPKDWYFVFELVQFRTGLGCVRLNHIGLPSMTS